MFKGQIIVVESCTYFRIFQYNFIFIAYHLSEIKFYTDFEI